MRRFTATAVSAVEIPDLNSLVVTLAERADGEGMRLELQRALSFDEQDRRRGQDTYCLAVETGAAHYGGISSWRLLDDTLEIRLDSGAAKSLGVTDGFVVKLESTTEARQHLNVWIQRVLGT